MEMYESGELAEVLGVDAADDAARRRAGAGQPAPAPLTIENRLS